jgi:quinohemoprotein ethanol dehydrogenase
VTVTFGVNDGDPHEGTAALLAYDPVTQSPRWRVEKPSMVPTGVIATAGGLVFQGSVDSTFSAYSAAEGTLLWSFDTQAPAMAPPLSYSLGGRQYVTILTGLGSVISSWGALLRRYNIDYRTLERRVLTFALDGAATLPAKRVPDLSNPADHDFKPDPDIVKRGSAVFSGRCAACHGFGAVSAGFAPDLRRSAIPLSADTFAAVVQKGSLMPNGMPEFGTLSSDDLEAMREYIRAQAHDASLDQRSNSTGMSMH